MPADEHHGLGEGLITQEKSYLLEVLFGQGSLSQILCKECTISCIDIALTSGNTTAPVQRLGEECLGHFSPDSSQSC